MIAKRSVTLFAAAVLMGVAGYALYRLGVDRGMKMAGSDAAGGTSMRAPQMAGDVDPTTGKRVLYWHDPMVPGPKFDKPGKSPFMDMQLVPMYAASGGDDNAVSVSSRVQQNLGVRTASVKPGTISMTVEAVGSTAYNERDVVVVQTRSSGFIGRLYVRAPLDPVRKGQPLAELYIPDWVAAQEEYLSAKRIAGQPVGKNIDGLVDAARQRLRLAGMSEEQIRSVEATGAVQARITLTAPIAGVVTDLSAREGMTVMAGAPLFRINGLSTIWVNAEVPENVAANVRPGHAVAARATALPGITFTGKVSAILPEVNAATRTLKARVELANRGNQLVPGMFVNVNFAPAARDDVLLVPSEAVIQTGKRSVVIVAQGDGKFVPVDVEVGLDTNGETEIRKGLQAGQNVVVSGQFLIDSEASLKASIARMADAGLQPAQQSMGTAHRAQGKVENITKNEITISHGPVASLQWGPMTMGFKLPPDGLPPGIIVGSDVTFEFGQNNEGLFAIQSITPVKRAEIPKAQPAKP